MTLMLVEERFHKTHPYRDRQYVWIRKLGSTEGNEQIVEFAILFMSSHNVCIVIEIIR